MYFFFIVHSLLRCVLTYFKPLRKERRIFSISLAYCSWLEWLLALWSSVWERFWHLGLGKGIPQLIINLCCKLGKQTGGRHAVLFAIPVPSCHRININILKWLIHLPYHLEYINECSALLFTGHLHVQFRRCSVHGDNVPLVP